MIGALIAIFFFLPIKNSTPKYALLTIKVSIIALATTQIYPIAIALIDEHHARRDFPVLSDFKTPFQIHRWGKSQDVSIVALDRSDNRALKVELTTYQYSGARLKYFPNNWEGNQYFHYRVYNPSNEAINLTCLIHDQIHTHGSQQYQDRFNRTSTIPPSLA